MNTDSPHTIHAHLGHNNILLIIPDGYCPESKKQNNCFTELGLTLTKKLGCYSVINSKYKKAIVDLDDVRTVRQRKKTTESFLLRIKSFKEEISGNNMLPLILVLKPLPAGTKHSQTLLLGYGQGERGENDKPHRPSISPSLLSKYRVALQDQTLKTEIAPTDSNFCGRESYCLNQVFRQKNYLEGIFDPEVRSLLIHISQDLYDQEHFEQTAQKIGSALLPFTQEMSLVRRIKLDNIDTVSQEDLQYIFRIHNDSRYPELFRETYIEELATSIDRNGLLHPLVLLQKDDGRYKILCGFRRFQAIKRLGKNWVEAKIYKEEDFSTEDFFNISLAENTRRRNLNPVEIGNFLESASQEMGLNNTRLAEKFGETLGIGKPGQSLSHSTVHKYRKVNKIRLQNQSQEMISDLINEKLSFSIAAEILAPIKDACDRDSLYLEIIKPLNPTRSQVLQIIDLLAPLGASLDEAVHSETVKKALATALESEQKAIIFIKLLQKNDTRDISHKKALFEDKVGQLRTTYFGDRANKRDFNITPSAKLNKGEYTLHIRIQEEHQQDILKNLQKILGDQQLLEELTKLSK